MVLHVHYNFWYISVSSSSKRRLEMTKFRVVWRTWTTTAAFLNFYIKFIAVFQIIFAIVSTVINKVNDLRTLRDS